MITINQSLLYLREALANYLDEDTISKKLYRKLKSGDYLDEIDFVEDLSGREISYLNRMLAKEMSYAKDINDRERLLQLNGIYELLI